MVLHGDERFKAVPRFFSSLSRCSYAGDHGTKGAIGHRILSRQKLRTEGYRLVRDTGSWLYVEYNVLIKESAWEDKYHPQLDQAVIRVRHSLARPSA